MERGGVGGVGGRGDERGVVGGEGEGVKCKRVG